MRRILILLSALSGIVLLSTSRANACGGTLTRVSDGPAFLRENAREHPSRVLIDATPESKALAALEPQLRPYLAKVGHQVTVVTTTEDLQRAMRQGQYDVVLTDIRLADSIRASGSTAVTVPLTYKLSKALKVTAKSYSVRVDNPEDADEYLLAIFKVMKLKTPKPVVLKTSKSTSKI